MTTPSKEAGRRSGGQNGFISVLPPCLAIPLAPVMVMTIKVHLRACRNLSHIAEVERIEALTEKARTALCFFFKTKNRATGQSPPPRAAYPTIMRIPKRPRLYLLGYQGDTKL
ncbi:unnamed protein product [Tuber aestivum]|uniref:Uncharacterized protein n=1 Tax=Tuber aestivum TaxID=59557 RepID=A0A292PLW0_9PEZI|nr:unnamed protein product [Tuber aestivum]